MAKVAFSVAHNLEKPGACFDGICEHELSAAWSAATARALLKLGHEAEVVYGYSLGGKVATVNATNPTCALEIHFNAAVNAQGAETLYYPGSDTGKVLAHAVQRQMVSLLGVKDRGIKEGWYRMEPPSVNPDAKPDYFLKATNCPAIIVEPEFMSNYKWIQSNIRDGAKAIATGIHNWLKESVHV